MNKLLLGLSALSVVAAPMVASAQPTRADVREERREARDARQDLRDAQRRGDRRDVREARQDYREERREANRTTRRYQYNGRYYDSYRAPYYAPRGWNGQRYARGQRLPAAYRGRVVDYRAYRLSAPPPGYRYERVGNDVYLTAITTGIITAVVAGLFFN